MLELFRYNVCISWNLRCGSSRFFGGNNCRKEILAFHSNIRRPLIVLHVLVMDGAYSDVLYLRYLTGWLVDGPGLEQLPEASH